MFHIALKRTPLFFFLFRNFFFLENVLKILFRKMFSLFTMVRHYCGYGSKLIYRLISILLKPVANRTKYTRLEVIGLMVLISLTLNIYSINRVFQCSSTSDEVKPLLIFPKSKDLNNNPISTIERSRKALEKLKVLLTSVMSPNDQQWIWSPTAQYPSVPYQPTSLLDQNIPKPIHNTLPLPQSVKDEMNRVCQRLNKAHKTGGEIWCKLFTKCYADTLATTTTLLDDNSTFIITGDIDLMWLRDSR